MSRLIALSVVILGVSTFLTQAQFLGSELFGVNAATDSKLNAGEQFQLGQDTALQKNNAEKLVCVK